MKLELHFVIVAKSQSELLRKYYGGLQVFLDSETLFTDKIGSIFIFFSAMWGCGDVFSAMWGCRDLTVSSEKRTDTPSNNYK